MDTKIVVHGGNPLIGHIRVSNAKNAVLPILIASILAEGESTIADVPHLADVDTTCALLQHMGCEVARQKGNIVIRAGSLSGEEAPYEFVRMMRASFLVLGPLLARLGRAVISLPGGCAIGSRPINLHLKGLEAMGAKVRLDHGHVEAHCRRLQGAQIYLDFPSVGATENLMMAASLAKGQTVIENAAEEPEIVDLANYLNRMGARIKGAGTPVIKIEGVERLQGGAYTPIPDRIEAGSYMVAAAAAGGDLTVDNIIIDHVKPVIAKLKEMGATVQEMETSLRVTVDRPLRAVDIKTLPYPGFPTDMQAQMMALLSVSTGTGVVTETVFENRFMHVDELKRMGAQIKVESRTAVVQGIPKLYGAPVKATDLRAGAALIVAALAADDRTEISCVHHIDRGYDDIVGKLRRVGARIERTPAEA
ncbi:udp-n-acetylglucosamine 1-carboxyvinyltransferase [Heliomicrobium modesticaldum Ice1]|uniref:UDP-N-acetylglucosamine 1-carboxyvinyltransferase n=1 Tax=Heliobacterium modesticaldum (strain ATCC 51547 / Ice1) TaxID=498761 RepID=B0THM7_HELMI|nr:UDP-N-acetylglucosamine 1-carboxyvinyltransferase [Heliomicrobium modesticaldum]ABZ83465.1 udp-n-acetylglucosamine 1-carboxyvinyltransferase [Heliomicrobium modesticaldum Ice1]